MADVLAWTTAVALTVLGFAALRSSFYIREKQQDYSHRFGEHSWLLGALWRLCILVTFAALWYGASSGWRVAFGTAIFPGAPFVSLTIAFGVLGFPVYLWWEIRKRDRGSSTPDQNARNAVEDLHFGEQRRELEREHRESDR